MLVYREQLDRDVLVGVLVPGFVHPGHRTYTAGDEALLAVTAGELADDGFLWQASDRRHYRDALEIWYPGGGREAEAGEVWRGRSRSRMLSHGRWGRRCGR